MSFGNDLRTRAEAFEAEFYPYIEGLPVSPKILKDSFAYSLTLGGKRIRPSLMLMMAEALSVQKEDILPYCYAIEMIHTYSLIHDDLPCMDNDDYRRGKPTNHKVFGEGQAVLAGDALLNTAYSICFSECTKGVRQIEASKYLCEAAGVYGMIAGQARDLDDTAKSDLTLADYLELSVCKTARLLQASLVIPCILADSKHRDLFEDFAKNVGILFQLTDDLLDEESTFEQLGKSIGKDKAQQKLTAVTLCGIDGCKRMIDFYTEVCGNSLKIVHNCENFRFLSDFLIYLKNRSY